MLDAKEPRMSLQHIETTISETTIRMRYADHNDPAQATQWFAFEVPIGPGLTLPTHGGDVALGALPTRLFASIQLAVLRYVRDAIGEETQRLAGLARH
jgi:hypothetical protein